MTLVKINSCKGFIVSLRVNFIAQKLGLLLLDFYLICAVKKTIAKIPATIPLFYTFK